MKQINDEVFYAEGAIVTLRRADMDVLKAKAKTAKRRRSRLCAHKDVADKLHEMFIIHGKDTYVRPHKHLGKSESFYVIEGATDIVLFDDKGKPTQVIAMGDYASGKNFYYRMPEGVFHTLLIRSRVIVFHEVTSGPFRKEDTVYASWSPEEKDTQGVKMFLSQLRKTI